jgi:hypothetical protein
MQRLDAIKSFGMEWRSPYYAHKSGAIISLDHVLESSAAEWDDLTSDVSDIISGYNRCQREMKESPQAIWNEIKRHVFEQIMQSGFSRKVVYESDIKAVFDALGVQTEEKNPF